MLYPLYRVIEKTEKNALLELKPKKSRKEDTKTFFVLFMRPFGEKGFDNWLEQKFLITRYRGYRAYKRNRGTLADDIEKLFEKRKGKSF